MKGKLFALTGLLATASVASADLIALTTIVGQMTSGPLSGQNIEAFIEIEDNGFTSGLATTAINPLEGSILALEFNIGTSGLFFFNEFDDPNPFVAFDENTNSSTPIVGIDYAGTNFLGDSWNIVYDAFAPTPEQAYSIEFVPLSGAPSSGTFDPSVLPVNVPEPGTVGLLFGLGILVALRRRA
ncbi:MAG: PEP-CTERM sorting domain-containing protein [Opitutales bacterium]